MEAGGMRTYSHTIPVNTVLVTERDGRNENVFSYHIRLYRTRRLRETGGMRTCSHTIPVYTVLVTERGGRNENVFSYHTRLHRTRDGERRAE
jgi:hypothetical protein